MRIEKKDNWYIIGLFFLSVSINAQIDTLQFEGKKVDYFAQGNVKSIIHYKNNKPDSLCIWYFENGKVQSSIWFKNGLKDGVAHYYRNNGVVESIIYFINDTSKIYLQFGVKGNLLRETSNKEEYYYINGQKYTTQEYIKEKTRKK